MRCPPQIAVVKIVSPGVANVVRYERTMRGVTPLHSTSNKGWRGMICILQRSLSPINRQAIPTKTLHQAIFICSSTCTCLRLLPYRSMYWNDGSYLCLFASSACESMLHILMLLVSTGTKGDSRSALPERETFCSAHACTVSS